MEKRRIFLLRRSCQDTDSLTARARCVGLWARDRIGKQRRRRTGIEKRRENGHKKSREKTGSIESREHS